MGPVGKNVGQAGIELRGIARLSLDASLRRRRTTEGANLTEPDVQVVLGALAAVVEPVRLAFLWRPMLADVDDDMVLETAINGQADMLVTLNRRDFKPAVGLFDVKIVSPAEAVVRLRRTR